MTLVVSWIGVDTHGVSSAYIMSESRISWEEPKKIEYFDYGKKVFAAKNYPELFGYAGDVLFPSIVLSQIVEMIDSRIMFNDKMTCDQKSKAVMDVLCFSLAKYPNNRPQHPVQIMYITRDTVVKGYPSFHCYLLSYNSRGYTKREIKEISLPKESGIIEALGSGKNEFETNYKLFQNTSNSNTSRNVYQCFVHTLKKMSEQNDKYCGGAPQLVGLYRKPDSYGRNYGIIFNGKRNMLGMELHSDYPFNNVEWRNEQFEICDGVTKMVLPDATKQPVPNVTE